MSSLALMRFLESAPHRYDWGMKLITFGGSTRVYDAIDDRNAALRPGKVLEIGCGTGAVTERVAREGTDVVALDQNPEMLDIARARMSKDQAQHVEWREMTASEIDTFADGAFESLIACFSLSEMASHERAFVFQQALRILQAGGVLVVGDEVVPTRRWKRMLSRLYRIPQLLLAWLLTDSWSKPIPHLPDELIAAGFTIVSEQRWHLDSLAVVVAKKDR